MADTHWLPGATQEPRLGRQACKMGPCSIQEVSLDNAKYTPDYR